MTSLDNSAGGLLGIYIEEDKCMLLICIVIYRIII